MGCSTRNDGLSGAEITTCLKVKDLKRDPIFRVLCKVRDRRDAGNVVTVRLLPYASISSGIALQTGHCVP